MLNNVEAERVRSGLSKEDISKKLNVTTKTYYNWIQEKTDIPSSKLIFMANLFNVNIDYLLNQEIQGGVS